MGKRRTPKRLVLPSRADRSSTGESLILKEPFAVPFDAEATGFKPATRPMKRLVCPLERKWKMVTLYRTTFQYATALNRTWACMHGCSRFSETAGDCER